MERVTRCWAFFFFSALFFSRLLGIDKEIEKEGYGKWQVINGNRNQ